MCVIICELLCQDPAKVKEALISSQVDLLRMKLSRSLRQGQDRSKVFYEWAVISCIMKDKGDVGRPVNKVGRTEGEEMMKFQVS